MIYVDSEDQARQAAFARLKEMYSNKTKTLQNTMTTDELMRYLCKLNQAGGESLDKPQKRDQTKETEHN